MRKFLTLFVALIIATVLWAQKFQYGDLYYNITSSSEPYTVEVTYKDDRFSYNYPGLTTATIPRTVKYYGTTYSVTSIGNDAFNSCYYLESINIPNSVTSIGYRAFQDCHSLTSIIIPNSVTRIRNKAFDETGIYRNKTNWENGVLYISHCLIEANTSISGSYSIKDNTRLIGDFAFQNCSSITSIIIPNGVTSIGEWAFECCSSLKSITCEAETPPTTGGFAFSGINTEIPVYVPCGCVVAYKVANEWKSFTNIQVSSLDCEEDDIITCDEAVMICEATGSTATTEEYTIRGYVTEIKTAYSEQYNNITFWMADSPNGGNVLQAYRVIPKEQTDIYVKVGDYVEVVGTLVNYYGNTPEVNAGGTYTIIQTDEDSSNPEDNPKESITVKAKMPVHWTNTISAWVWGEHSSGHWVTPTKEGDWYVVTQDVEELNIIFVNGTNWSGDKNQTIDMTFSNDICIQLAQEGSDKATYTTIDCEGNDTPKDDEEDDGAITCAEAVSICQETGTTITTEKYTIRGYVTYIASAYSEQYNNITFWMADTPNGGKVLQAYRVIPVEANDIDVKVGDYVEVVGSLVNYYGTTPEVYTGGTYTIIPEGVTTDANNIKEATDGSYIKFLRDGQLLIHRDGKTYNLMGQEL